MKIKVIYEAVSTQDGRTRYICDSNIITITDICITFGQIPYHTSNSDESQHIIKTIPDLLSGDRNSVDINLCKYNDSLTFVNRVGTEVYQVVKNKIGPDCYYAELKCSDIALSNEMLHIENSIPVNIGRRISLIYDKEFIDGSSLVNKLLKTHKQQNEQRNNNMTTQTTQTNNNVINQMQIMGNDIIYSGCVSMMEASLEKSSTLVARNINDKFGVSVPSFVVNIIPTVIVGAILYFMPMPWLSIKKRESLKSAYYNMITVRIGSFLGTSIVNMVNDILEPIKSIAQNTPEE